MKETEVASGATALERAQTALGDQYTEWRQLHPGKRIFTAYSVNLKQRVVVKYTSSQDRDAMTRLHHQYLPMIYAFQPDEIFPDKGYLVMQDIPGITLRQYVNLYGAVSQKQTFTWLRELLEAVAFLHHASGDGMIIHCDIKPDNILIVPGRRGAENHICLIDYNIARITKRGKAQSVGRSEYYAAPEQYPELFPEYSGVSERTDLYSIGAVACYMLSGKNPENPNPEAPQQVEKFLKQYDIEVGYILRQMIVRCMRHNPAERFSSAEKLKTLTDKGNLQKLDVKIRALRVKKMVAALLCGIGVLLSLFLCFRGWDTRQASLSESYNEKVTTAQQLTDERRDGEAERVLSDAVKLNPKRPEAYANLGKLLCEQGRFLEAETWMLQLDTEGAKGLGSEEAARAYAQVQYLLGVCWYQKGETADAAKTGRSGEWFSEALSAYEYAYEHYPESAVYCRDLALCRARTGNAEGAEKALSALRVLDTSPGDRELVEGEIACYRGNWLEGLELMESALERTDNDTVVNHASITAANACRRLGEEYLLREIGILEDAVSRLAPMGYTAQLHLLVDDYTRLGDLTQESRYYDAALGAYRRLTKRLSAENVAFSLYTQLNASAALIRLSRLDEAESLLVELQNAYDGDYRPVVRLGLLYCQEELSKPEEIRSGERARRCYEEAVRLGGAGDEMEQLKNIVSTLP